MSELLRVGGVSKTFPGTRALDDVGFDLRRGEIHCLVGHNGSGKSTLIKVMSGYHTPDPGAQAWFDGEPVSFSELSAGGHRGARRMSFVHQNLGLVNELGVVDNLALRGGYRRSRIGTIDWRREAAQAEALIQPFGIDIDVRRPLASATPVERTIVAIAAALQGWDPSGGALVLDEPTAVLPPSEVGRLFAILRDLRSRGASILYVSHRLEEIFELGDRTTVLRDGKHVVTTPVTGLTTQQLVGHMLGAEVEADYRPDLAPTPKDLALEVRELHGRFLRGASFALHAGEILGVAGLPDAGRDELPRVLSTKVGYPVSGAVRVAGPSATWHDIGRWNRGGIAFVPPDRIKEGVIDRMSVAENLTLSVLDQINSPRGLRRRKESVVVDRWMDRLNVMAGSPEQPVATLSGGNQQKVLIGRTLAREPKVLVMCEPTAGVDIGARRAIYDVVTAQARNGLSVFVSSSDVEDLIGLCTRVLVLRHGVVAGELAGSDINEHRLVHAMEGFEDD